MKTKITFNDIPNVIERDEMKQVLGGGYNSIIWGNSPGSGHFNDILPVVIEDGGALKISFSFGGSTVFTFTIPKDTLWGGQLKDTPVYKNSDPRSPNYNPYGQWTASTIAEVFKNIGDSISAGGITLAATGIGAGAGGAIMTIGSFVSGAGTIINLGVDIYGNTWESFDGEKWIINGLLEATNFGAGKLGMPEGAEAYYNAGAISAGRGIDYMTEFRDPN